MSRRLPADQRRAQLLASALEIAERQGLGAVTVRGVADRSGVSLGVVHYCFTDKEELLREVINTVNGDLASAADAFLNVEFESGLGGPDMLRSRLREAIDLIWAVISASPNRQLLTYEIIAYSLRTHGLPEIGLASGQYEGYDQIITTVLDRTTDAVGMRWTTDHETLIRLTMSIIDGVALRWQIDRDDDTALAVLHEAVDLLVGYAAAAD